ncbi:glycoside hydrolase family 13 protein [Peribacillus frigoritolerans]|uniref:glycoside hydrolase family 13 protein n=1 Tax=Peribacillus frigoritolerans TaxID=450367 RepID=UPI00105AA10C|nr:alpha-glucosidase [Peribacillus frigoritolerans]TDL77953.1 alpha-glucosidase [Peribacillus frigoritolerans]
MSNKQEQWWKESVVYQIYPKSYYDSNGDGIGDIKGIIAKLDYLQELGIDVIWLSPVYQSPNDDNGYDISDYEAILDDFGTMTDWDELLNHMHSRGMRLVMDLVVNHTSDEHTWFAEARKSKDNPHRDYYIWRPPFDGKEPTDWVASFGGSAWELDEETGDYYLHMFSKKQPDLNWENPELRDSIYKMMKFWLDKGIDGFRMDVINMISKKEVLSSYEDYENQRAKLKDYAFNGERVHDFLQEMNKEVLSDYDIMTVGECPKVTPHEAKLYTDEARKELNMVFQFEHMGLDKIKGKSKWDLKPLSLLDLKENLSKWQKELENTGWNSLYWNNHDQPRVVSRFGNDKEYRVESAKMLATLLHMMKGTPYIYQGEEIGMTNVKFNQIEEYKDIETLNMYKERVLEQGRDQMEIMDAIHKKSRDNARTPMQWNNSKNAGFTEGNPWISVNPNYPEINVEHSLQDPDSIFHYYKKLIDLRHTHKIIVYGGYDLLLENHPAIFAYTRTLGNERLLIVNNFYAVEAEFLLPENLPYKAAELFIANYPVDESEPISRIMLKPYESRVYKLTL